MYECSSHESLCQDGKRFLINATTFRGPRKLKIQPIRSNGAYNIYQQCNKPDSWKSRAQNNYTVPDRYSIAYPKKMRVLNAKILARKQCATKAMTKVKISQDGAWPQHKAASEADVLPWLNGAAN